MCVRQMSLQIFGHRRFKIAARKTAADHLRIPTTLVLLVSVK